MLDLTPADNAAERLTLKLSRTMLRTAEVARACLGQSARYTARR